MIEVQCTSCHTRYRIDEQVLPEGLPTFKCSRCGHVFTYEPRKSRLEGKPGSAASKPEAAETSDRPSASRARPPEGTEASSSMVGREAPSQPLPSVQESVAAGVSDILDRPPAGSAHASVQSEPAKDEEPAWRRQHPTRPDLESKPQHRDEPDEAATLSAPQSASSAQLGAQQAEKFASRVFADKNPDDQSVEDLSFDFGDDEPAPDQARLTRGSRDLETASQPSGRESKRWEVGDDDPIPAAMRWEESRQRGEEALARLSRRRTRADDPEPQFDDDDGLVNEDEAPVFNRAITHSARFFLLLILLVGAGFGAVTLLIHSAPGRSSALLSYLPTIGDRFVLPETPAKLVALRDVNAAYQESKERRKTLVISGTAENVGTESLRIVQLTAALHDAQGHSLASQAVYCGNNVSAGMIGQMTPHEIEFFQKLEPARTFALEPSASCRFVAVFFNPPGAAHAYDVSVSEAIPGIAQNVDEPAS
jgi:predicted Zn finger-like uncharacterized protein